MSDLPRVNIVATTYYPTSQKGIDRLASLKHCIESWAENLKYRGNLGLHIADDGTRLPDFLEELGLIWQRRRPPMPRLTNSWQNRKGVGASLNQGFANVFIDSPFAMYIMDDWFLEQEIDLNPWVALLLRDESIGMVRIGPPHPGLTGKIVNYPEGWGLLLDKHDFAFGMRPALYHERFFEAYGYFSEGDSAVECERKYNVHMCDSPGPDIVYAVIQPWHHMRILDLGEVEPCE